MVTRYLIKEKTHSFLTQLLNIIYPLKDSKSFLFSKISLESLNPSRNFLICFYFTPYLYFLDFCILLAMSFFVLFFLLFYSQALWNFGARWLWIFKFILYIKVFIEKKVLSQVFDWVLNTPLLSFRFSH